jgi:hypothetical protein
MEIKSYRVGDEKKIIELFKLCFNQTLSLEYWNWRFLDNPFTSDLFIELMWDKDKLVGHYSVSPVDILIDGIKHKSALSMTTMTHPSYSNKGVFTSLANSLFKKLNEKEFDVVFGFPNQNSHFGFKSKLNWKDIAVIPMYSLQREKFEHLRNNFKFNCHTEITEEFANYLIKSNCKITIDKSKKYLNWRYINNPSNKYTILSTDNANGVVIFKKFKSQNDSLKIDIDLMDIRFNNDYQILVNLLSAIINFCDEDIQSFNCWNSVFSKDNSVFEKIGFTYCSPLTFFSYHSLNGRHSDYSDLSNWDITMSLSDVF